jgi:hypothetical protein
MSSIGSPMMKPVMSAISVDQTRMRSREPVLRNAKLKKARSGEIIPPTP